VRLKPETTTAGNHVQLLHDGEQCFPAMLEAIAAARHEILLEMYWFGSDATGLRFADALGAKAREGVRVCVTYDAVGSFEADPAMFEQLRRDGCGVHVFNPLEFFRRRFRFARLNRRNHRKQLIVDGRIGITGGVNLGDPWAPESEGGLGFRDDMIRIEGPAAQAMRAIFLTTYAGPHRNEALAAALGSDEPVGTCSVRVLANQPRAQRRVIERAYLARIRSARSRILITNSYFIPSRIIRNALASAARRGVSVRVLLPVESDVPAVAYATRRLYEWLLTHGIELYEWGQSILHSKTAVIDGDWCTVGTHNIDHRSWAYNLEINVVVEHSAVTRMLEAKMQSDFDSSVPVELRTWRFRPIGTRILELIFYAFRSLM
jgi:cardiolipin synthase A/B